MYRNPVKLCFAAVLIGAENREAMTPEALKEGAQDYLRYGGLSDQQIQEIEKVLTD